MQNSEYYKNLFIDYRNKTKELEGPLYTDRHFNEEIYNTIKIKGYKACPAIIASCANDVYTESVLNDNFYKQKENEMKIQEIRQILKKFQDKPELTLQVLLEQGWIDENGLIRSDLTDKMNDAVFNAFKDPIGE